MRKRVSLGRAQTTGHWERTESPGFPDGKSRMVDSRMEADQHTPNWMQVAGPAVLILDNGCIASLKK